MPNIFISAAGICLAFIISSALADECREKGNCNVYINAAPGMSINKYNQQMDLTSSISENHRIAYQTTPANGKGPSAIKGTISLGNNCNCNIDVTRADFEYHTYWFSVKLGGDLCHKAIYTANSHLNIYLKENCDLKNPSPAQANKT